MSCEQRWRHKTMYEPPSTISPSRLQSFLSCPLKFKFQSLDGLQSAPTLPAIRGSILHLALEYLFHLEIENRDSNHLNECVDRAFIEYAERSDYQELALDEKETAKLVSDVHKLADNYMRMENPQQIEPKGVELRLEVELNGWTLRGVIDRLDAPDGELEVVDYKTGRPPSQAWEAKSMMGVNLYALMCQKEYGTLPTSVRLMYVRDLVNLSSSPTEQSTRALERKVDAIRTAVWKACETGSFTAKKNTLCNFCDYKPWCPVWGGNPDSIMVEFPKRVRPDY
jgi:putative RecB family exonuclease